MQPDRKPRVRVAPLSVAGVVVLGGIAVALGVFSSDEDAPSRPVMPVASTLEPQTPPVSVAPIPLAPLAPTEIPPDVQREVETAAAGLSPDARPVAVRVAWGDRRPCPDAQVVARPAVGNGAGVETGSRTHGVTGRSGAAALALRPGRWMIFAGARTASVFGADGSSPLTVPRGGSPDVTVVLDSHDATLVVTVEDGSGARVPDVAVDLASPPNARPALVTDSTGVATFTNLPGGDVVVRLDPRRSNAPGFAIDPSSLYSTKLEASRPGAITVRLQKFGALDIRPSMSLDGGHRARVTIKRRWLASTPLPKAGVSPDPSDLERTVDLGSDGARVEGLLPGAYVLTCALPADAFQWTRARVMVSVEPERCATATIPIARGTCTLAGRAVDDRGAPVAGLPIAIEFPLQDELVHQTVKSTRTDADGRFRVRGLPRAPLLLAPDVFAIADRELVHPNTASVPALRMDAPREDVVLRFQNGFHVKGRVVHVDFGTPAPVGCQVTLRGENTQFLAILNTTLAGGECTFEQRRLPPDVYVLSAMNGRIPGPEARIAIGPQSPGGGEFVTLKRPR